MEFVAKKKLFFDQPVPQGMNDPYLDGLDKVTSFLDEYTQNNPGSPIVINGDYDADGEISTAILYWMFRAVGIEVKMRIPKRISEGYGYIPDDEIEEGLLIAVDNGIASIDPVTRLKEKGVSVVIIDHHLPNADGILPPADVILDPNAVPDDKSGFKDYCGAGLAYRVALSFLDKRRPGMNLTQLRCLAGLATIADVVSVLGANRILVADALSDVNAGRMVPGLKMLVKRLRLGCHVTEEDFGFVLGPVLNAAGRLFDDGASKVLELLTASSDCDHLDILADFVIKCNEDRKRIVNSSKKYLESVYDGSRPIVMEDDNLPEGVVGIIAGHLAEEYHSPAIVLTRTEGDILKGSGRSIPEINLKDVLDQCRDHLLSYGGHAGAAGLSLMASEYDAFVKAFTEAVGDIPDAPDVIYYDEELDPEKVKETYDRMHEYAPFGEGNPKPLFRLVYKPEGDFRRIGDRTHFMSDEGSFTLIGFGIADDYAVARFCPKIEFLGYLSLDWWNGRSSLKFEVRMIKTDD